jgi:hypothetical protein
MGSANLGPHSTEQQEYELQAIPNLAGVATADLVEQIGTGSFKASYVNWSRTMHLLRTNAPGWLPELVPALDGGLLHKAPIGCYLLIRFSNGDNFTPAVPQAIMDTRNAAIPAERITARDVTDTHRRGVCMAAAFTFGLAYELWAKIPLESGHGDEEPEKPQAQSDKRIKTTEEVFKKLQPEVQDLLRKAAPRIDAAMPDMAVVQERVDWVLNNYSAEDRNDIEAGLYHLLDSATRSALKRVP